VLVLLTVAGGWWVWHKTLGMPQANSILLAWMVYAIGSCLNFVSGRWPALLTGIGALRTANQIGIIGMLVYYVVSVAGLLAGWGIWSLVAGTFLMGLVSRTIGRIVFSRLAALPGGLPAPHFHREIFSAIWPNAWRTGLVSLGAYLIVQANTLICSAFLGLITTASYGLSFQMVMILSGVSAVWVQVKLPEINQLRVPGDYRRIAVLFTTRIRLTILTYFLGAVTLIFAGPQILALIGSKTALLPSPLLILLCVIQFLEMHHSQYGGLVLSENHNPFIIPALLSGGVIVLGSFILAPIFGVYGLLLSAGIVQLAFNNWWTVFRGISGLRMSAASYWWLFFTGKVEKI
jgi:O-antigen/teichoic acid export membrane protein